MKILPLLVAGSLAANVALVAVYVTRSHDAAPATGGSAGHPVRTDVPEAAKSSSSNNATTSVAIGEKSNDSDAAPAGTAWAALNTSDLHALADRLRAAGFPPSVVRTVIGLKINELFKERRAALQSQQTEKPFWNTQPMFGPVEDTKLYSAMRELSREQGKMLRDILGEEIAAADNGFQRRRFGDISRSKIEQIQQIDSDYNDLRNEVNVASRGIMLPEDRQKLAMLDQEKRNDLASVLSPAELEDYLMRTSRTTQQLRQTFGLFNATEAEFKSIYAAQSAFDEKYNNQGGMIGFNSESGRERQEAQKQVNEQIKTALGDGRYAEYLRASDREFQQLARMAQGQSISNDALVQTYNLRDNASKESNRIAGDNSLSVDQKRGALQTLAQTTRAQITSTLGDTVAPSYLKVADSWLNSIERGGAVTFMENGNGRSVRMVGPGPRPAPNGSATIAPTAPIQVAPIQVR